MEKRKLKPLGSRRPDPEDSVRIKELAKEISERTGYRVRDVIEVWRVGIDLILENLQNNKSTILPKIGMFYPTIKPARDVANMKGGVGDFGRMELPARWVIKFRPGEYVTKQLLETPPTKEQIDDLYED